MGFRIDFNICLTVKRKLKVSCRRDIVNNPYEKSAGIGLEIVNAVAVFFAGICLAYDFIFQPAVAECLSSEGDYFACFIVRCYIGEKGLDCIVKVSDR